MASLHFMKTDSSVADSTDFLCDTRCDDQVNVKPSPAQPTGDKHCSRCKATKPITDFFYRPHEDRYESQCKTCKRDARLARQRKTKNTIVGEHRPERFIEPPCLRADVVNEPEGIIEPTPSRVNADSTDFSLWVRLYGRQLSDVERSEIKTNLTEFFSLLLTENQKLKGSRGDVQTNQ